MSPVRFHSPVRYPPSQSGFTLIEVMVTVAILAILTSLAAPSFLTFFERYRVEAARDNLVASIQLSRTEAIRTGQRVVLRRKITCANNDWSCGWEIFVDTNLDGVRQNSEPIVKETEAAPSLQIAKNGVADLIAVNIFGQLDGNAVTTFTLRPQNKTNNAACMALAVNTGMRLTTTKGSGTCP